MAFNTEPSAAALERYLDAGPDWEEIVMMLFSHGVDSIGLAPIERWRELLGRGTRSGTLAGTDPDRYPRDFGVFTRYHRDLDRVATTGGAPPRLSLDAVDGLAGERAGGPVRLS
jgi:hypothetical protein